MEEAVANLEAFVKYWSVVDIVALWSADCFSAEGWVHRSIGVGWLVGKDASYIVPFARILVMTSARCMVVVQVDNWFRSMSVRFGDCRVDADLGSSNWSEVGLWQGCMEKTGKRMRIEVVLVLLLVVLSLAA